jgi:CxxC-x17-CxxC domain-containing protein
MRIFGDDKYSGRRKSKSYGDNNNRGRSSNTEMFDAVCDSCGNNCKVPFKPTSGKPIYCSNCFEKQGGGNSRGSNNRGGRSNYSNNRGSRNTEMFSAVCDDCGNDCKVPFKPSSDKPIYCSDCFEKVNENKSSGNTELLEKIDKKLDYIVETLKYGKGKY